MMVGRMEMKMMKALRLARVDGELRVGYDAARRCVAFSFDGAGRAFLMRRLRDALPHDHAMFVCDELDETAFEVVEFDCRYDVEMNGFVVSFDADAQKLLSIRCAPERMRCLCDDLQGAEAPVEYPVELIGSSEPGCLRFECRDA